MNTQLRALHLVDLAYQLATKIIRSNKLEGQIPSRKGVMDAMATIPKFSTIYCQIPFGDDGKPDFNNSTSDYNQVNLYGGEYDRLEEETLIALDSMKKLQVGDINRALDAVMADREGDDPYLLPDPEGDEGFMADYCISRMIFTGRRGYYELRAARRGVYPAWSQCTWTDFIGVIETTIQAVDADEGYVGTSDVADSFQNEEENLWAALNAASTQDLQLVEAAKVKPLLDAANSAWAWVQHLGAEQSAQDAFENQIHLARERVEQNKRDKIHIATKTKHAA